MKMAGIDVHKKVLMVVVVDTTVPEEKPVSRGRSSRPGRVAQKTGEVRPDPGSEED